MEREPALPQGLAAAPAIAPAPLPSPSATNMAPGPAAEAIRQRDGGDGGLQDAARLFGVIAERRGKGSGAAVAKEREAKGRRRE